MGYDTTFHALDGGLAEARVLPFIAGDGAEHDIDDLIARAVSNARLHGQIESWKWGAYRLLKPGVPDKLPSGLDPHVWDRPFFIVADTGEQVAEQWLRWMATTPEKVEDLAREMADRLSPGLAGKLVPDRQEPMPDDAQLHASFARPLHRLRDACAALRAGRTSFTDECGQEREPAAHLGWSAPFHVLQLLAWLTPGWKSRGAWPTLLYIEADLEAPFFVSAEPLYGLLGERFPQIVWEGAAQTIGENYTVGGYVPPGDVAAARADLAARRGQLLHVHAPDHHDHIIANLVQVDEAMALALRLGFGFCEATEIYGTLWT